jgi:hypothetical protein
MPQYMICAVCTSYPRMLAWRWSSKTEVCCHNNILTLTQCCCVWTVILKHSVLLLELKHNGKSSITKTFLIYLPTQRLFAVNLQCCSPDLQDIRVWYVQKCMSLFMCSWKITKASVDSGQLVWNVSQPQETAGYDAACRSHFTWTCFNHNVHVLTR